MTHDKRAYEPFIREEVICSDRNKVPILVEKYGIVIPDGLVLDNYIIKRDVICGRESFPYLVERDG